MCGRRDALNVKAVAGYVSTSLMADLFGVKPDKLARAVVKYRRENE